MLAWTCLTGLLLAVASPVSAGSSDDDLLARAEAAFRRGGAARSRPTEARQAFTEAADAYEALRKRGAHNPDLDRNEAHAALLAGRLPLGILAYRRGLRLAPADTSLRDGLEQARNKVAYSPGSQSRPPAESWPAWLPWPGSGLLLTLALAAHALAWVAATRWLMTRRILPVFLGIVALALAGFLGGWWWIRQDAQAWEAREPLVVVAANRAALHTGNGPSYPRHEQMPALARGMEGRRLFERGAWLQVAFPGGVTGWVRRADVLVDRP